MPNYCNYEMKVRGSMANVRTLFDWLRAEYHYSETSYDNDTKTYKEIPATKPYVFIKDENTNEKIPMQHHIGYRVFSCYDELAPVTETNKDDIVVCYAYGDCAWSVYSCMFDGGQGCYMSDKNMIRDNIPRQAISINDACKKLGVEVEIFSSETGCEFAEHYYINVKGEILVNEETTYQELYFEDCETYEDFCETYGDNTLTQDEFNEYSQNDYYFFCDWLENKSDGTSWNWEYLI